jgi:hypothetical protein
MIGFRAQEFPLKGGIALPGGSAVRGARVKKSQLTIVCNAL